MPTIFISYRRRGESAGYAGRLAAELRAHFGPDQLFRDIEKIEPGRDFVEVITSAVASCNALIAVIGEDWLTATDTAGRRRLDDPQDFLHLEVTTALNRNIRVIPVLVGEATMPRADDLPDALKPLARRQAHELSDTRWDFDMQQLIATLEKAGIRRRRSLEAPPPLLTRGWFKWALGIGGALAVAAAAWFLRPIILGSFEASPPEIPTGSAAMLRWRTADADEVELDGMGVGPADSAEVHPARTTIYHLTARGQDRQADRKLTVRVAAAPPDAAPRIISFEADTSRVSPGTVVRLHWHTANAEAVTLGGRPVAAASSERVTPTTTTSYQLIATGAAGRADTATVRVEVLAVGPPRIDELQASPAAVTPGQSARLCYALVNVSRARLDPGVGPLTSLGRDCLPVTPAQTTAYTLTARGAGGQDVARTITVEVTAIPPPGITYFFPTPEAVAPGNQAALCYGVTAADSAHIAPDVGAVKPVDKECVPVTPSSTTTYTLTAFGSGGATRTERATVDVVQVSAAAPVTTVRRPPTSHSTGSLTIPQTWTADLDEGVVGGGADADIWFEAVTPTERYVTPGRGAVIAKVGSQSVGRDGCVAARLSATKISIADLPVGTYVCVRTNGRRYAQFKVVARVGPSPGVLQIGYTTWEGAVAIPSK